MEFQWHFSHLQVQYDTTRVETTTHVMPVLKRSLSMLMTLDLACRATRKSLQTIRHRLRLPNTHRNGLTMSRNASDFLNPRQEALTLVHKVSKFVPTVLSVKVDSDSTRSVELWDRLLSRLYEDLATEHTRPIQIAGKSTYHLPAKNIDAYP
jgi:hypothetical protein